MKRTDSRVDGSISNNDIVDHNDAADAKISKQRTKMMNRDGRFGRTLFVLLIMATLIFSLVSGSPQQQPYNNNGYSTNAFIGLIVGTSTSGLIIISSAIICCLRRRNRRRVVKPSEYRALKLTVESKKSFDSTTSSKGKKKKERTPTTLLPARELLFPTQMSAAHHKTIYGAKNADTPVWDVKSDIERRGTIRIPKTRKTWFPALTTRTQAQNTKKATENKERQMADDKKTDRARKTTSWLAAFKKSSGIGESDATSSSSSLAVSNNNSLSPQSTTPDDLPPSIPVTAARRSRSPLSSPKLSPRTSPRSQSPELNVDVPGAESAKKAFLAGLDLRDSRRPKTPITATTPAINPVLPESQSAPKLTIRLGQGIERRDVSSSGTPANAPPSNTRNIPPVPPIPPIPPISNTGNIGGDLQTTAAHGGRLSWNPTVTRRETLRSGGGGGAASGAGGAGSGNATTASINARRSMRRAKKEAAAAAAAAASSNENLSVISDNSSDGGLGGGGSGTNISNTGNGGNNNTSQQLKRQSLFGEGSGMLEMDLERSSNLD
ncbi:5174_t:CDS:2 [Ambispora gerdemannii]|uniref:5174_t:CDS:1 n=1 Tax=Ambispora gerdemannii TaxID=144530 RepID=A0A9N9BIU9_9GLOM|nr:5174_t:CDS:2 [Ambispora gerdemannii]